MDHPKISIITVVYNDLAGLKKTVASVVEQSFQDLEHIIIDGSSTDGTVEYLDSNKEKFQHRSSEPDSGIFNAMNKGINSASGEFLQFLNAGDVFTHSKALETFVEHSNFKGDIIYGDYTFTTGEKIYPDAVTPLYFMRSSLPHQSTFFHRRVFEAMGGYDESYKIISDRAFYMKCFLQTNFVFRHITYPLVQFDLNGKSNSLEYRNQKLAEDDRAFKEFYGKYYNDYKRYLVLEKELSEAKRNTLKGILKRAKRKLGL